MFAVSYVPSISQVTCRHGIVRAYNWHWRLLGAHGSEHMGSTHSSSDALLTHRSLEGRLHLSTKAVQHVLSYQSLLMKAKGPT